MTLSNPLLKLLSHESIRKYNPDILSENVTRTFVRSR